MIPTSTAARWPNVAVAVATLLLCLVVGGFTLVLALFSIEMPQSDPLWQIYGWIVSATVTITCLSVVALLLCTLARSRGGAVMNLLAGIVGIVLGGALTTIGPTARVYGAVVIGIGLLIVAVGLWGSITGMVTTAVVPRQNLDEWAWQQVQAHHRTR